MEMGTLLVICGASAYSVWGVPASSKLLTARLPDNLLNQAARDTLLLIEESLERTELSAERQQEIKDGMQRIVPDYPIDKLRFYQVATWGPMPLRCQAAPSF